MTRCFRRVLLVPIVAFALLLEAAGQDQRPGVASDADRARWEPSALSWIQKNASPFASDAPTPDELKPLIASLEGARVVGFGEATHGDHQSQLFKTHAIRELVRQGRIDSLMLEVNRNAGSEFDAYVNEGKGDLTHLIMESGIFSIWRTDDFANLIGWLRGHVIRTGRPFRVYGVDCQNAPVDLAFALRYMDRHLRREARAARKVLGPLLESEKDGRTFYGWIKTQPKESYARYHAATTAMIGALEVHGKAGKAKDGFAEALYAAEVGLQELEVLELQFGPGDVDWAKAPPGYMSRRDVFMGRNLVRRLGDGRAALWAHDMHTVGTVPPPVAAMGYTTLGVEVRKSLADKYVAVGFVWTYGAFRAKLFKPGTSITDAQVAQTSVFALNCDRPGDLGEFFRQVGPARFYADFRQADEATRNWGSLMYYRGWCGWGVDPDRWQSDPNQEAAPVLPLHDILVYTQRISPSTTWQLPPKKG